MQPENLKVIVVGGAIGGSAAALLLARAGAHVTLIERVAEPRAVGAGIAIAANGMAVLESLGLAPAIQQHGRPVDGARIVDSRRRTIVEPRGPRILMLRRSALQEILLDALADEPGVETYFGTEVTYADSDGNITATTPTGELTLKADLVIGADGVHSRIRHGGQFDAHVSPPGIPYVRTVIDGELAHNEEAWTGAGIFGSFNVEGGTYLYASATSIECRRAIEAENLEDFQNAWAAAYPDGAGLFERVERWEDLLVNNVIRVDCKRWYDGRLVLLGDAAHAMAPNVGQGANSALVDAAVLLDEIRSASDMPSALEAYQQRRAPAVRRVADTADRLGALSERTHPMLRMLRDRLLMPLADRLAGDHAEEMILQEPAGTLLEIGSREAGRWGSREAENA